MDAVREDARQETSRDGAARLHYLDWLQVLAVLGVFLFHAVHPFDDVFGWHIKNAESSRAANAFIVFFFAWGMPLFFLMAGATSWFSLRRRTAGRYVRERVTRLLVPFIVGSIVLTPIQAFFEYAHKGWWKAPNILKFILNGEARVGFYTLVNPIAFRPAVLGVGYHLWFVGGLFLFALLGLPLFLWSKRDAGRRFLGSFARLASWRGGPLVFVIPLVLVRFALQPGLTDWADFFFYFLFFVSGYVLIADERFMQAIRRDWLLHMALGVGGTLFFLSSELGAPAFDWLGSPGTLGFYASRAVWSLASWCWTMVVMHVGMRYLDFTNSRLGYGREASYPFFFVHQPAIIFIAYYAVQWEVHLLIKMLVVVIGSFALSLALYELLVRRFNPVRALFGMKPRSK
jgi:peptidoglycan/LPS O-acetylase OafA/YrhL